MFLPPMERCRIIGAYVRLDQRYRECAAAHCCARAETQCPLRARFPDGTGAHGPADGEPIAPGREPLDLVL